MKNTKGYNPLFITAQRPFSVGGLVTCQDKIYHISGAHLWILDWEEFYKYKISKLGHVLQSINPSREVLNSRLGGSVPRALRFFLWTFQNKIDGNYILTLNLNLRLYLRA
jgi:hypothetical protein